jgi:hypothetical protein
MHQAMGGPQGQPLAVNAMAALAALGPARVAEFTQPLDRRAANDGQFNLPRVLQAARSQNPVERVKAIVALCEFMRAPDVARRRGGPAQVREMVTKADFPTNSFLAQYISRFLVIPGEIDYGYEMIFDIHDVAQAEGMPLKGSFKTLDVSSGVTFRKLKYGERVQVEAIAGAEVETPYDLYGGAVGFNKVWFDDADYITIGDLLTIFRAQYYDKRASSFYSLITALGAGINFNTGGDLMAKMNGAAAAILRSVKDKGYQAAANSEFIVLHPPEKAGDVQAALNIRSDVATMTATGKQAAVFRFVPVQSVYVASNDGPYVILPKRKLRGGYRMDLTLYGEFDIYSYAEAMSGWGRYAGLVGDSAQVKRIT